MDNFSFSTISDIKAEEKRLHDEYTQRLSELKSLQKSKETTGQIFTKGLLPIYVLHILTKGPANGNDIAQKIGHHTNGLWIPSTGGIYPLLKKFEKESFVIGTWDDPKKKFQKIYSLTDKGLVEYEARRHLLRPKIEEALRVFKIIYTDLYKN